jgi:hypothetical protein
MPWHEHARRGCTTFGSFVDSQVRLGQVRLLCAPLDRSLEVVELIAAMGAVLLRPGIVVEGLSDSGMPLDEISRLVGHSSTTVTEAVYRKQIRPVLQGGATVMDRIFVDRSHAVSHATADTRSSDVQGRPEKTGRGGGV